MTTHERKRGKQIGNRINEIIFRQVLDNQTKEKKDFFPGK
jgi:hypothetical protein